MERKPLSLYLHIPFCVRKCAYCDFLSFPAGEEVKHAYKEALLREIWEAGERYSEYEVKTIFFGGGTPTLLGGAVLSEILGCVFSSFSVDATAEITAECNPGTVTLAELRSMREGGFNRLSIGVQSLRDEELLLLGRIHTRQQFLDCYRWAREAGFTNINLDLMEALPGQSAETLEATLREAVSLLPEHISAYSLIIEEGTPFFERYEQAVSEREKEGCDKGHLLPSEEEERAMDRLTEEILSEAGYERYEISNYALPGRECRHNCVYWQRGEYLGLGLGGASLMKGVRFSDTNSMEEYLKGNFKEYSSEQVLSREDAMAEFMFLGLRMCRGVCSRDFERCFSVTLEEVYGPVIKKQIEDGFLQRRELAEGEFTLSFTPRGRDVSNPLLAEYLFT